MFQKKNWITLVLFFFCIDYSWKTIEIVRFTTFVQRAAVRIVLPTELSLATSYKACSLRSVSVCMLFEHNESKYFIFLCVRVFVFLVVSDKCYLLTGRSVLGKIVPEVLTTGTLGRVQFFPIWTDLSWWITVFSYTLRNVFQKIPNESGL